MRKSFPKIQSVWAMRKCMISMVTCNAMLKNKGRPILAIISQLLLILGYLACYQIQTYKNNFRFMVRYVNYQICIFINSN